MTTCQLCDLQHSYSQIYVLTPPTDIPGFYCRGSIRPGITYVEKTPTKEHDQFYSNALHQSFYNLHDSHNTRNANKYHWSHNKQESSRIFKIGLY